jgi:hypothetical protein
MSRKQKAALLTVAAIVVLALGLTIIIWVVQPNVFPECPPEDITFSSCDPTGHPPTDERIALRLTILGVATVSRSFSSSGAGA